MGVSHQPPATTSHQPPATSMATKESKPKAPATHPKYIDMITAAIPALKERMGSSRQAILKYFVTNYKVDAAKAVVATRLALKAGVAKGAIKNAKETGKGAGKYKVVKVEKPKREAKKPAEKKTAEKKSTTPKKAASKKPAAKKATPKKKPAAKKTSPKKTPAAKKTASPKKKPATKKPVAKSPAAKKPAAKKPAAKNLHLRSKTVFLCISLWR